jgi:hypothetical protein
MIYQLPSPLRGCRMREFVYFLVTSNSLLNPFQRNPLDR